jgi:hypothetical protein
VRIYTVMYVDPYDSGLDSEVRSAWTTREAAEAALLEQQRAITTINSESVPGYHVDELEVNGALDLLPEEWAEIERHGRCDRCGHLDVLHDQEVGYCNVDGCTVCVPSSRYAHLSLQELQDEMNRLNADRAALDLLGRGTTVRPVFRWGPGEGEQ